MILQLVRSAYFRLDTQGGLGRNGVGINGHCLRLKTKMTFAVICNLDVTSFAWCDRLARIVGSSASAAFFNTRDNQRHVASIGETESVRNNFALENSAKVEFSFSERDDRLFVSWCLRRLGIVDQFGGQCPTQLLAFPTP